MCRMEEKLWLWRSFLAGRLALDDRPLQPMSIYNVNSALVFMGLCMARDGAWLKSLGVVREEQHTSLYRER